MNLDTVPSNTTAKTLNIVSMSIWVLAMLIVVVTIVITVYNEI